MRPLAYARYCTGGVAPEGDDMAKPNSMIEPHDSSRGIAEREKRTDVDGLDRAVRILDDFIRIPILNVRIGLDPILGLLPLAAGDALSAFFSFYLMGVAIQYGLPKVIILRMAMNVVFDYLIGIIPLIGDASDFFIKSNRWNLNLLRRYAQERRRPSFSDYLFVIVVIGALVSLIAAGIALIFYWFKSISRLR
ncbi:MAG: DUF4112 domain-containing protein, partial [Blastocatellia bacterium]